MRTMRVQSEMMDRETILAISLTQSQAQPTTANQGIIWSVWGQYEKGLTMNLKEGGGRLPQLTNTEK